MNKLLATPAQASMPSSVIMLHTSGTNSLKTAGRSNSSYLFLMYFKCILISFNVIFMPL